MRYKKDKWDTGSWNEVLNLVIDIKKDYIAKFVQIHEGLTITGMIEELGNEEYKNIFKPLQTTEWGEFILLRYGLQEMALGFWEDPESIYRECRSVVIDWYREKLVLTPFKKFFNINEVEETMEDKLIKDIEKASIVEVTDKLDGSMQSARWYQGRVFTTGSKALSSENSWRLAEGKKLLNNNNYIEMISDFPSWTFIFEYVSPKNPHVIPYSDDDEGMYLLGARNVRDGVEMSYQDTHKLAVTYGVKHARIENKNLDTLLKEMKEYTSDEKEGWVMNIDGLKTKIKCDDYVNVHRILDKVGSNNVILKNIYNGTIDDFMSKVPTGHRDRINKIKSKITFYINQMELAINILYSKAPKGSKKEYMIWVSNTENVPKTFKKYLINIYLDEEYSTLEKANKQVKKMKQVQEELEEADSIVEEGINID